MGILRMLVAPAALLFAHASPVAAQTLADIRGELRNSLSSVQFAGAFAALITLSDELELSSATYNIRGATDTSLSTLALPLRRTCRPWGEEAPGIYLEGAVGRSIASQSSADLFGGTVPALATAVNADWASYGGMGGIGIEVPVTDALTVTPIFNAGIARIESDAEYGGPGAPVSATLFNGIAFNWDAWTASVGGALRVNWIKPLGNRLKLEIVGRYDIRWTETFEADDVAQEFSNRLQVVTLRTDLTGPTGLHPFGHELNWRAMIAYRRFLQGDLYDIEDFIMLGGSLELDVRGMVPLIQAVTLSGGYIHGHDVTGYTFGVGIPF
jgi:hypothetical protein